MISKLLLNWILILNFIQCFISRSSQANDTSSNECLPQLADTCFQKLSKSLDCQQNVFCDEPEDFCELLDDSLKCSADIIDGDCSKINGTLKFDSWYKGLRAVYSYLCRSVNTNGTHESLPNFRNSKCWNKKIFVKCVGEMLNIHHVVDMLKTSYDYKECVRMIISMTACNENSRSTSCTGFHETFINDLVFIFFSQHKCEEFKPNYAVHSFLPKPALIVALTVLTHFK